LTRESIPLRIREYDWQLTWSITSTTFWTRSSVAGMSNMSGRILAHLRRNAADDEKV
jgi:hypothetical protein